jgi:methyl coenzyme M reductase alpha subunit
MDGLLTHNNMTTIQNSTDLLNFIITQASSGQKNWFGFQEQKIAGINTAYAMAINHANEMTPDEIVEYVVSLNNAIYQKIIKGD